MHADRPFSGMRRPKISTNLAITADGKISPAAGIPSGWTSAADHSRLLALRADADALLVGRGTWESDRMTLTVPGKAHQPLRCIVSRSGKFDANHPVFRKPGGDIHLLTTGGTPAEKRFFPPGAKIVHHGQSLKDFLTTLVTDHAVSTLHCEGGGQLIRALAELDAIDEFHLTLAAHTVFGGARSKTATGIPGDFLPRSIQFRLSHFDPRPEFGECFLSYVRIRETSQ